MRTKLKSFLSVDSVQDLSEVNVTSDELFDTILTNFGEWSFIHRTETPTSEFLVKFKQWKKHHYTYFLKAYEGLTANYNPVENYDKYSELTHTGSDRDTNTFGSSTTTNNEATAIASITTSSQAGYVGDDSLTANPQSTNTTTTTPDGQTDTSKSTSTKSGEDTYTHTYNSTNGEHTHGNIGVTTSAQMIEAEFRMRAKVNILDMIAKSLVDTYCILLTEV